MQRTPMTIVTIIAGIAITRRRIATIAKEHPRMTIIYNGFTTGITLSSLVSVYVITTLIL